MAGRSRLLSTLLVVVVAAGIFAAGYGVGQRVVVAGPSDEQGFSLLRELLAHVRGEFLHQAPDSAKLFDGAARGMLEALGDPYTRYMDARAFSEFSRDAQGFFFGIGIFIDIREGSLMVVQPIEGTPAHRAGLRAGDRILRIDQTSTGGMALQEAVTRIRGPAGTRVKLRIGRADRAFDVEITRDRIRIVTVQGAGSLEEALRRELGSQKLGYIRVLTFNEQTAKEVASALEALRGQGARGLLLDLRSNGGGLLEAAIRVADRFVPAGEPIVHVVARDGRRKTERAGGGSKLRVPVVVLVNEFTASASEILAGALRDSAGAVIVGRQTFGKGVIQSLYTLPGGGAAALTTAKYLTPANGDIHGVGVAPGVVSGERLEGKSDSQVAGIQEEQFRRALEVLRQRVDRAR